jgi:FlaA1/EpsC-like NDP-sugar epimerase
VHEVGSQHDLPFAAVRFRQRPRAVRGSVVPTFLRQILDGGPVTVTDPDMTRYFMTIPEAVSLVLQAGAMADEGNVFLLDMGQPVSIIDLARQMIRLAGLRPDDDIEIRITGSRPGERLHEQLHDEAEIVSPTRHSSIKGVRPKSPPDPQTVFFFLELLEQSCAEATNDAAVASLLATVAAALRHRLPPRARVVAGHRPRAASRRTSGRRAPPAFLRYSAAGPGSSKGCRSHVRRDRRSSRSSSAWSHRTNAGS